MILPLPSPGTIRARQWAGGCIRGCHSY